MENMYNEIGEWGCNISNGTDEILLITMLLQGNELKNWSMWLLKSIKENDMGY